MKLRTVLLFIGRIFLQGAFIVAGCWPDLVFAEVVYEVDPLATAKQGFVKFSVNYNCVIKTCVHNGEAREIQGTLEGDGQGFVRKAQFHLFIEDLSTFNKVRDCHMREALGLDYSVSKFPREHVCEGSQLPSVGPDSLAYPEIVLTLVRVLDGPASLNSLASEPVLRRDLLVTVKIHNVTKDVVLKQVVLKQNDERHLVLQSQFILDRRSFDIVVKPFSLGFAEMTVDNDIRVDVKLILKRATHGEF